MVPWAKSPHPRSATSQLLDFVTRVPALVSAVLGVMTDRIDWLLSGCNAPRSETPDTVPWLQRRVEAIQADLQAWRSGWEAQNPLATHILAWAYQRAADDAYRPCISGLHGPDIFDTNIFDSIAAGGVPEPDGDDAATFDTMQEVALYTTVLVWANRLSRYLSGAALSPTSISFLSAPFHTTCTCMDLPPMPCEVNPPPTLDFHGADPAMTWNLSACRMAVAPMRVADDDYEVSSASARWPPPSELDGGSLMVPGDVRFAAQLRILQWLADRLPRTRGQVLCTLAAIGLGHCSHDVRPADGIQEVAHAVTKVLDNTKFEGADSILLRKYK